MVRHYVKAGSPTPATANTSQNDHSSRRSVLYIKNVSEETARILGKHEMQVGHKKGGTFLQLLLKPRVDVGETNITLSEGSPAMRDHLPVTETDRNFDFENANAINHGCL